MMVYKGNPEIIKIFHMNQVLLKSLKTDMSLLDSDRVDELIV